MDGKQLQIWRENQGLTRAELADKLKTTYTTIFRWETGMREIPPYLELALKTLEKKKK